MDLDVGAKLSVGIAKITAKTKESVQLRRPFRDYLETRTENRLKSINQELLAKAKTDLKAKGQRGLVVILDNLDRVGIRNLPSGRSLPDYLFIDRGEQLWRCGSDEFSCAIRELNSRVINLEPHLNADLEFVFGLDKYISVRIEEANIYFQRSFQFWQEEIDNIVVNKWHSGKNYNFSFPSHAPVPLSSHVLRQGVLLFYIGL
ncbi:Type II secretory pathway, ATPase PulE/Tfp pilus assembly pathway, ATPase PilB [Richelia intracellularis]|nr:Type II secretory pathway, ATPase PulE/Tfp pilus assembly pathway, ATPase PilB [Richelia intracellularis]